MRPPGDPGTRQSALRPPLDGRPIRDSVVKIDQEIDQPAQLLTMGGALEVRRWQVLQANAGHRTLDEHPVPENLARPQELWKADATPVLAELMEQLEVLTLLPEHVRLTARELDHERRRALAADEGEHADSQLVVGIPPEYDGAPGLTTEA